MHSNKFYRLAIMLTLLLASAVTNVSAQKRHGGSPADRQKWEAEMIQYKHDRLTKELGLNDEQATRFLLCMTRWTVNAGLCSTTTHACARR